MEEQKGDLVPVSTEDASASAVTVFQAGSNPYLGISSKPVTEEQAKKLLAPIEPYDVEIKPDGMLYLPEIKYRRVLNATFGPAGWGMAPLSGITMQDNTMSREFALYVGGNFVACARGEQDYQPSNPNMSWATASESVKSNAVMRCCKDLGIASELWDPNFLLNWRNEYAVEVWCENVGTGTNAGKKKKLWRRKDRAPLGYPWKENGEVRSDSPTPRSAPVKSSPKDVPDRQDPIVEKAKDIFNGEELPVEEAPAKPDQMSKPQANRLYAIGKSKGWSNDEMSTLAKEFGGETFWKCSWKMSKKIEERLNAGI